MPYPSHVYVTLVACNGNSCGSLGHRLEHKDVSPPEYGAVAGEGDLDYARCKQIDLGGGQYTWELSTRYLAEPTSPCYGRRTYRRSTAADDPTGDYCLYVNGSLDCNAGTAAVVDDSDQTDAPESA